MVRSGAIVMGRDRASCGVRNKAIQLDDVSDSGGRRPCSSASPSTEIGILTVLTRGSRG